MEKGGGEGGDAVAYTVRPLTADLWPALEELFGKAGASNGCWCMYWRLGPAYKKQSREANRAALERIVKRGPAPGLLAFDGSLSVGWCQITPRVDMPWLDRAPHLVRVDDMPVWSISCFFVRRGYRLSGVTAALIARAVDMARHAGAPAIEAYPVDARQPNATQNRFTGLASTFEKAGFRVVAGKTPQRPIMRLDLGDDEASSS